MNLRSLSPTQQDLSDTEIAIRSFPGAYGSIDSAGEFRPSAGDSRMLVIFIPITSNSMTELWRVSGIATDAKSSFATMQSSPEHWIDVYFFKLRRGLFGSIWVGNVKLSFAKSEIVIGSIAGSTQEAMWRQLREFIDGEGNLYDSTDAAVTAATAH
jgi:hypothetical protein